VANWIFELLRGYFDQHGYLTVFFALLLENAGIPVPGETILLFASFLAFSEQELKLSKIILVGIAAATIGDNLGYMIGMKGGRRLLKRYKSIFRVPDSMIEKGERLFQQHGQWTIFFARFIFGMRIIAGPLAGVLRMPWKQFVLFNFLGATAWVVVISFIGYKFGEEWESLIKVMGRVNVLIALIALYVAAKIWLRYRARRQKSQAGDTSD
jgi:membrane protein DedA with SNARE-associated domain